MVAALLAILFLLMIAAPCVVALRSAPRDIESEEMQAGETPEEVATPAFVADPPVVRARAAKAPPAQPSMAQPSVAQPSMARTQADEDDDYLPLPQVGSVSLQQLAVQAEREAIVAESRARRAYWAALDAAARAAAIRADAAAEVAELAGRAAEQAILDAEAEFGQGFLKGDHAPLDSILARGDRRAA